MKKICCFLLFVSGFFLASAQPSNVAIFSESGSPFFLYLNGVQLNSNASNHIKMENLQMDKYVLRLQFANQALGGLEAQILTSPGRETSYGVGKSMRGGYELRFFSEFTLGYNPIVPVSQTSISLNETGHSATIGQPGNTGNVGTPGGDVVVDINYNNTGNTPPPPVDPVGDPQLVVEPDPEPIEVIHDPEPAYNPLPGYTGAIGCPLPVQEGEFAEIRASVEAKSFESSKLNLAKQAISNKCLLSSHVKQIMVLFSFESSKLDFAKFAHDHTYDIGNYYKVNDAFTFESSIKELDKHIENK